MQVAGAAWITSKAGTVWRRQAVRRTSQLALQLLQAPLLICRQQLALVHSLGFNLRDGGWGEGRDSYWRK